MNGEQVVRALRDRTTLDVSEPAVLNAVAGRTAAEVEAACKQVVDWFVSGQTRTSSAAPILMAALRAQAAPAKRSRADDATRAADHMRQKREWAQTHLPDLPEVFVVSALFTEWPDPDVQTVRGIVARKVKQLEADEAENAKRKAAA